jgi:hypothetical protein
MLKAISTKVVRKLPAEFVDVYVTHGHAACEEMYGKGPTLRYKRMAGKLRLNRMRRTAVTPGADDGTVLA